MSIERTLSIIKPDATSRNLESAINEILTSNDLEIIASKKLTLSENQAKEFYAEHKERGFYNDLVSYMTSGPVVVQVLEGENAVARYREVMGATNPASAEEGTIRQKYGESIERNCVHGSDSLKSAEREISFFFNDEL